MSQNTYSMTLRELHEAGYSVAIFNPQELRGADPDDVAEAMVGIGWEAITMLATEPADNQDQDDDNELPPWIEP